MSPLFFLKEIHQPQVININHTVDEVPVQDHSQKEVEEIPDDKSEVSSIVSTRTEYQDLPSRSSLLGSTLESGATTLTNFGSLGPLRLNQTGK